MAQAVPLPPLAPGGWIPMTWEEFLAWSPEGKTEWVDGKGIAFVSNSARHVRFVVFLGALLHTFARVFKLGEVLAENMLIRAPSRPAGRMPDFLVVGHGALGDAHARVVDGPALLAIEILSEESVDRDVGEKRDDYERAGIVEYLILDARPDRDLLIYPRLDADGRYQPVAPDELGRYHSAALPGFWLDPAWFQREPLPDIEDLLLEMAPRAIVPGC